MSRFERRLAERRRLTEIPDLARRLRDALAERRRDPDPEADALIAEADRRLPPDEKASDRPPR